MARTNNSDLQDIFDTDLSTTALDAWIEIANEIVDDIAAADSSIDSTRLTKIEKLLAAHFAAAQDPRLAEYRVGDAQGTYQGEYGMAINGTVYGQQALMLDPTGVLGRVGKPKAGLTVPNARQIDTEASSTD